MKTTQEIKFSAIKTLEKLDDKIRNKLSRNIYFIPYLFLLIWVLFSLCLYSYRYI